MAVPPSIVLPMMIGLACLRSSSGEFLAGAAAVNIDPPRLPVLRNGGFLQQSANRVASPLFARSLVLDDGPERVAICVVDSCMLDRELCDAAKALATAASGIRADRILISATHTHSAPSAMRALGCAADPDYPAFLVPRIAESIGRAAGSLRPAQAGWAVGDAGQFTNCRRWIRLPHKMQTDPFGLPSVRAMMHPGHLSPDVAGPSGPIDPDFTLLSIRGRDGRPLAVLGNFAMHYFGAADLSPDFTGELCRLLEEGAAQESPQSVPMVALMSQGTSGDLHYMDYSIAASEQPYKGNPDGFHAYCRDLAGVAREALGRVRHRADVSLAMAETEITLDRKVPDAARLAWAGPIVAATDGPPKDQREVYAAEAHWLRDNPRATLKLQAIRIGEMGVTAIPNEVYGLTGLKLKLQSPLQPTMNIELANGAEGYIAPPEQHFLGGYTTWPARTAGLEVEAEPKIVEAVLGLLEKAGGRPRREPAVQPGAYTGCVMKCRPCAGWTMDTHSGSMLPDMTGHGHHATLEPGHALFLPGPQGGAFTATERGNRAVHFAGGRMIADLPSLGGSYSAAFWFWNAMPPTARPVAGYLVSRGADQSPEGDHLGIGGTQSHAGRLIFYNGDSSRELLAGRTDLTLKRWHHVVIVRDGERVRVHLDGESRPEIEGTITVTRAADPKLYLGGRSDRRFGFEGRLDEVAVFDRALGPAELEALLDAAATNPNSP